MRKMPSMIITMYIRPRRMMWIQSVVKTKEKSVNMRPAGIYPAGLFKFPGYQILGLDIAVYQIFRRRFGRFWALMESLIQILSLNRI